MFVVCFEFHIAMVCKTNQLPSSVLWKSPTTMENGFEDEKRPLIDIPDEVVDPDAFLDSLVYAINSFTAVLKPISVTMILASVIVSNVQSEVQQASFTAFDTSSQESQTNTVRLEKSIANSLIIVAVLATATFGIVCLYKFRFMKILVG